MRAQLVQAASDALGTFEPVEVPASLRAVRRFAPRRRASAGAGPIWTALVHEDGFRSGVARVWSLANPELAAQVVDGEPDAVSAGRGRWVAPGDDQLASPRAARAARAGRG